MPSAATQLAIGLVLASLMGASPAAAQHEPASEPDGPVSAEEHEARALFEAGRVAFAEGRFEAALTRFREAYELSGRAELLFNVAVSADRLRRDEEAIEAFAAYLRQRPDAPNRAEVLARLEVLEGESAPDEPDEPDEPPDAPSAAPWILIGSGAALAVGGAVLLGIGLSDRDEVEGLTAADGRRWEDVIDTHDRVPLLTGVGIAGLAVGLAAIAAGAGWRLLSDGRTEVLAGPGSLKLRWML